VLVVSWLGADTEAGAACKLFSSACEEEASMQVLDDWVD
jgi:hypothetical protein